MADEATVRSSLQIRTGNLSYNSQPSGFQADVSGVKGPCPGAFAVSTSGTDVDLSELSSPGLCRIANLDSTNFVEWGIWEPLISHFYVLGRILAGESYIIRLSPHLGYEYGVGTGTVGGVNTLRFKADTAAVNVLVEAFES